MIFTLFKNARFLFVYFFVTTILLLNSSCKRNDLNLPNYHPFDNSSTVTTTIYGRILNSSGSVVSGAQVLCAGHTTTTDAFGFFMFKNILTPKRATTVHVHANAYFPGSRTFSVKANDCVKADIVLMPMGTPQQFNSTEEADVHFDKLDLHFGKNSIVSKTSGLPYSGIVQVYAHVLDPTDSITRLTMPGALLGLTQDGLEERLLTSYGMFVAELQDLNGNPLQIKPNEQVHFSLTVPSALMSKAPSSVPLWHFDESSTLWQEEGQAQLVSGNYEGDVSHFSFWSNNMPSSAVYLEMTLEDQLNAPLGGYYVKLTNLNTNEFCYGMTSSNGWVGGYVYANANLLIEVYYSTYSFACGLLPPIYSQTITTGNGNINLGMLTITIPSSLSTVEGTAIDCSNLPVANVGFYLLDYNQICYSNNNGQFKFTLPCFTNSVVSISQLSLDMNANYVANSSNYNVTPGFNNIGYYSVCDTLHRFMNYTIEDDTAGVSKYVENVFPYGGCNTQINYSDNSLDFSSGPKPIYFTSLDTTIGTHPIVKSFIYHPYDEISSPFETYFVLDSTMSSTVTITDFPNGPGLISGSFYINLRGQSTGLKYHSFGTFKSYRSN